MPKGIPKVKKKPETLNLRVSQGVPLRVGYCIWKRRWTRWEGLWMRWERIWEEQIQWRTDSPFTALINGHPLPPKFKTPSLDSYDGTHDPFDHIATFKTTMHLQGVLDEIMCRAFPTTLKGPARVWFSKIPSNSVSSFEELSKLFVNNFIGGQRHKRSSSSLLTIEQGENESLRSFITCFNQEALTVDEVDDKLLLAAFHNGVNSDLFIHKL